MGLVEVAAPLQQQSTLSGWPKYQRREDVRVFQLHGTTNARLVETFPAQEPQHRPHPERKAQQVWVVEALGQSDSLLGRLHARTGLIGMAERVCQRDQDLHPLPAAGLR